MQTQNDRENAWTYEKQMDKALESHKEKKDVWIKTGFWTGHWRKDNEKDMG